MLVSNQASVLHVVSLRVCRNFGVYRCCLFPSRSPAFDRNAEHNSMSQYGRPVDCTDTLSIMSNYSKLQRTWRPGPSFV